MKVRSVWDTKRFAKKKEKKRHTFEKSIHMFLISFLSSLHTNFIRNCYMKVVVDFYCKVQSDADGNEDSCKVLMKREHQRSNWERSGEIDNDVTGMPNTSKYMVFKVARVAKHGQDWLEFDKGKTPVESLRWRFWRLQHFLLQIVCIFNLGG